MFKVDSRVDYGLLIMLELAAKEKELTPLSKISKRLKISSVYLTQISKLLSQADLIESREGILGGYKLKRSAKKINLLEIIEALEGPVAKRCLNHSKMCPTAPVCPAKSAWDIILPNIKTVLKKQSLFDLLQ